jgi:hypothetical protein
MVAISGWDSVGIQQEKETISGTRGESSMAFSVRRVLCTFPLLDAPWMLETIALS